MNYESPPSEQELLEYQKIQTFAGTVTHERGLDVEESSGFIVMSSNFVVVFGDSNTLVRDQHRVLIPYHRVIKVVGDE